ncbi:hypothetical protein ACRAWF_15170 [Streptomyces sp. L7]
MRFTPEQRIDHPAPLGGGNGTGRDGAEVCGPYSLSLGGSHALLNDWVNNEQLMDLLTSEERRSVYEARERARQ